jgi:hypothetical protein
MAQGVGPEFNPQYHAKRKKKERNTKTYEGMLIYVNNCKNTIFFELDKI